MDRNVTDEKYLGNYVALELASHKVIAFDNDISVVIKAADKRAGTVIILYISEDRSVFLHRMLNE